MAAVAAALAEALAAAEGRGLAVRVTLSGATALHGAGSTATAGKAAERGAAAAPLIGSRASSCHPTGRGAALAERGDALGALARRIGALAEAPQRRPAGRLAGATARQAAAGRCRRTHPLDDPHAGAGPRARPAAGAAGGGDAPTPLMLESYGPFRASGTELRSGRADQPAGRAERRGQVGAAARLRRPAVRIPEHADEPGCTAPRPCGCTARVVAGGGRRRWSGARAAATRCRTAPRPVAPEALQRLLGSADERLFADLFALDSQLLREGGHELSRASGRLGRMLLAGSGGLGRVQSCWKRWSRRATRSAVPSTGTSPGRCGGRRRRRRRRAAAGHAALRPEAFLALERVADEAAAPLEVLRRSGWPWRPTRPPDRGAGGAALAGTAQRRAGRAGGGRRRAAAGAGVRDPLAPGRRRDAAASAAAAGPRARPRRPRRRWRVCPRHHAAASGRADRGGVPRRGSGRQRRG